MEEGSAKFPLIALFELVNKKTFKSAMALTMLVALKLDNQPTQKNKPSTKTIAVKQTCCDCNCSAGLLAMRMQSAIASIGRPNRQCVASKSCCVASNHSKQVGCMARNDAWIVWRL